MLSTPLLKEDAVGVSAHGVAHGRGGSVGGIVVDHKHVETLRKRHHSVEHPGDVLYLVEGRYNYDYVLHSIAGVCSHHSAKIDNYADRNAKNRLKNDIKFFQHLDRMV